MSNQQSGKKMFNFAHLGLINCFLKDASSVTSNNESRIVEDLILEHYLNQNRDIAFSISTYLFLGEEGIVATGKSLFSQFAALPECLDNSAYPLVDFYRVLERENPTDISKTEMNLTHFFRCLSDLRDFFSVYANSEEYFAKTTEGKLVNIYDVRYEISALDELIEVFQNGLEEYPSGNISRILDLVCKCWMLPLPDGRPLRNFSFLYRFLADLMDIAHYPSTPENRFQLARIAKEVRFFDSSRV